MTHNREIPKVLVVAEEHIRALKLDNAWPSGDDLAAGARKAVKADTLSKHALQELAIEALTARLGVDLERRIQESEDFVMSRLRYPGPV